MKIASRNEHFRHVLFTNNQIEVTVQTLQPGQNIPWEKHDTQTQVFQLIDHEMTIDVDTETIHLHRGQILVIPPNTNHQVRNETNHKVRFITFYAPPEHTMGRIDN